jgi:hypothetical protein
MCTSHAAHQLLLVGSICFTLAIDMIEIGQLNKLIKKYIRRPTALMMVTPQKAEAVAQAILVIAEDAAERKDSDTLRNMYWLSASLISCQPDELEDHPIGFIDLYEYITFLDDSVEVGVDPFTDPFLQEYRIGVVEGISLSGEQTTQK